MVQVIVHVVTVVYLLRATRERLKYRIQRFHDQLTKGCGRESCDNPDCATGSGKALDSTAAAAQAVILAKQGKTARLCEPRNCCSSSSESVRLSDKSSLSSAGSTSASVSSGSVRTGDTEPMDTTDSVEDSSLGVEPSSSTDSTTSSTLILVTSHMDTTGQSSRSRKAVASTKEGKVDGGKPIPPLPHIGMLL